MPSTRLLITCAAIVVACVVLVAGRQLPASQRQASAAGAYNSIAFPSAAGAFSSIQLDSAGNPVVSFDSAGKLVLLHCGNPYCTSGNTIGYPDFAGIDGGGYSSLQLDAAGNPIIAYWPDGTFRDLNLAHCGDPTCTTGNVTVSIDMVGDVGQLASMALDAAGNPVVSYFDATNFDVKLVHCGNPNCTSGNTIVTLEAGAVNDVGTSLALDALGKPVVAFCMFAPPNCGELRLVFCGDAACSSGNLTVTADASGDVGLYPELKLDSFGRPVVSYYDNTNSALKLLHCGDATCTAGNSFAFSDSVGSEGIGTNALALDAAGNPVISYIKASSLQVEHCGNPNCTSGNTIAVPDGPMDSPGLTSIILDSSGYPVVSYYDSLDGSLRVLHCSTADCLKVAPTPTATQTLTPVRSPTATPTPPSVGGVSLDARLHRSPGGDVGLLAGAIAGATAIAFALGGGVWYVRRRRVL